MTLTLTKNSIYTDEELAVIDRKTAPAHVAIIMDGNRRWQKQKRGREGHRAGTENLLTIVQAAEELGIKTLTVFGFSTENWMRSRSEVALLLRLFQSYLSEYRQMMKERGIAFHVIGDITAFPDRLREEIVKTVEATRDGKKIQFVCALNYGGRDEIVRAMGSMITDYEKRKLKKEEITEEKVASYLDTAAFGDPVLLIRTSGEMRLSNFLLWQLAYTEIYVTEKLWPAFTPNELLKAVGAYQGRQRRYGR